MLGHRLPIGYKNRMDYGRWSGPGPSSDVSFALGHESPSTSYNMANMACQHVKKEKRCPCLKDTLSFWEKYKHTIC